MQKSILSFLLIISLSASAQPYLSIGATYKEAVGVTAGAGVVAGTLDFSLNYDLPLSRTDIPRYLSATIGKQVTSGPYTFTLAAGMAASKYMNWAKYDAYEADYGEPVAELKPLVTLEAGWNKHVGRLYLQGKYMNGFYVGVGMKVFLK